LRVLDQWITASQEEEVFLCHRRATNRRRGHRPSAIGHRKS
jgi:hypothetical protein